MELNRKTGRERCSAMRALFGGMAMIFASAVLSPALAAPSVAAGASVQTAADNTPASTLSYADGETSSGWVPFEFFSGSRILIPVTVNGRPVMAMLDSGASSTVMDRAFVTDLGLGMTGSETGGASGGSVGYSLVKGADVELGKLRWTGGEAVAIDLTAVSRQIGRPLPIVLGGEMFAGAVVEIDFVGRRIAFHDPGSYAAPPEAVSAPLATAGENRSIEILVEGRPANLLFDLGNAGNLDLSPRFWRHSGFMDGRRTSTTFAGGAGGMHEQKITLLDRIAIGGVDFHDVPARLPDETANGDPEDPLDGNLGIGVLGRFHLTVDFPHDRVLFAAPIDQARPFAVNHAGLSLRPGDTGSLVLHVAAESPAARAGLKPGDIIASVDGVAQAGASASGWQSGPAGSTVRLRLADGRDLDLTLAAYF